MKQVKKIQSGNVIIQDALYAGQTRGGLLRGDSY